MSAQSAAVPAMDAGALRDHPAARAWEAVEPGRPPRSIEALRPARRKSIFRLGGVRPDGTAVIAKRRRSSDLHVERLLYSEVLPSLPVATPEMYGAVGDPDSEHHSWIFLEDAGDAWHRPDTPECRGLAAEWLAFLHVSSSAWVERIPDRSPRYFRALADSVIDEMRTAAGHPAMAADVAVLDAIERHVSSLVERWGEIEAACAVAPVGLVHGDFVPKNIRIRRRAGAAELVAFDWETAGAGSPAGDLALIADEASLCHYHAHVRGSWPGTGPPEIHRLAHAGRTMRLLQYVHWEALPAQLDAWNLRFPWIGRTIERLAVYERDLRRVAGAEPPGR